MVKITLIQGHILEALKKIPDNSVDCIVTSPPYWGLRRYPDSANTIWDGDPNCQHEWNFETRKGQSGGKNNPYAEKLKIKGMENFKEFPDTQYAFCKKCGAWFGQLGLEPSLDLYINHLLQITAELKRVLKPTGVMFWNHGDCYGGAMHFTSNTKSDAPCNRGRWKPNEPIERKYPEKCMAMQNYRLALRMIDEQGWILRNIIIWHKPNHLPESIKDRFTKAYEPIFMFVKNKKYFFNLDAVREPIKTESIERYERGATLNQKHTINNPRLSMSFNYRVREAKKGYFEKLGVKASEEEMKRYDDQGKPIKWNKNNPSLLTTGIYESLIGHSGYLKVDGTLAVNPLGKNPGDVWTIPTQPFPEAHFAVFPEKLPELCIRAGSKEGATVLDPFLGTGTTAVVARKLGRRWIGIEINKKYCEIAQKRISRTVRQLELYQSTMFSISCRNFSF